MTYNLCRIHFIRFKNISQIRRSYGILGQYCVYQFPQKLEFSTNTSIRSRFLHSNENLGQFFSHFQSFKPLMERNNLGILIDLQDYKEKKKLLKESLKKLEDDLENFDDKSLLGILMYCLEMSDKCLNYNFNLKLVELLISRFQSSTSSTAGSKVDGSSTYNYSIYSTTSDSSTTDTDSDTETNLNLNLSSNINTISTFMGLDYSFITKILKDELHLIYLLSSFLKLKLHNNLEKHFEFFYISLNRNIGNYSSENLVELCKNLGDLYLITNMGGLKILVQKCVYSLLEQIDKYNVNVSLYNWIQLIKSISKCNENHMFKKLGPYLISSIQLNPFTSIINNYYQYQYQQDNFNLSNDNDNNKNNKLDVDKEKEKEKVSEDKNRKCYKFIKLNIHLLNTLLITGIIDNVNLFDNILQLISNYLLFYTIQSSKPFNLFGYLSDSKNINEYNKPNELVNELLYKKYTNKVFKSPSYTSTSSLSDLSSNQKKEENIMECSLLNLLNNGKVTFVRGLKLSEMYIRTLYPNLYNKLSKNNILEVSKQFIFDNKKEYINVTNILNQNREIIQKYTSEQDSPFIVLVDIYYLICTNYNKKVYVEVLSQNNRNNTGTTTTIRSKVDNITNNTTGNNNNSTTSSSNKEKYNKDISNNYENNTYNYSLNDTKYRDSTSSNIENDNYGISSSTNRQIKLNKQMEFKKQYLESLGWTCIQIYKS